MPRGPEPGDYRIVIKLNGSDTGDEGDGSGGGPGGPGGHGDGVRIGRMLIEADNMGPKPVFAGTDDPAPLWVVGEMGGGLSILVNRNTQVTSNGGVISGLLVNPPQAIRWLITPAPQAGLFRIADPGTDNVWTVAPGPLPAQIVLAAPTGAANQAFGFI
ncbi:hypothetical protein P691DRAFT_758746 [Macrolepiota fuliginosa MF-IS2]|uniref:Uncharacterized protein n=1 Tax=Macrolepiota fuliginosa MF-IS2 TaxID=1400762 RepID=A0A9P6C5G6_9AGAR|nr:hypothetical protein P691DRAFT_758746 [Macrolepiota fuliginosa MF-IS2]